MFKNRPHIQLTVADACVINQSESGLWKDGGRGGLLTFTDQSGADYTVVQLKRQTSIYYELTCYDHSVFFIKGDSRVTWWI